MSNVSASLQEQSPLVIRGGYVPEILQPENFNTKDFMLEMIDFVLKQRTTKEKINSSFSLWIVKTADTKTIHDELLF